MYGRSHYLLALGLLVCFAFHNYLEGAVSPILNATPIHEAFVPKFTDADGPAIITQQPPAPLQQSRPPQPATDHVWIHGYWAWSDIASEYRWVCGVWRRPPPGKLWINGEWLSLQGGWGWRQGFWSTVPQDQLTYIELQPPAAIDDKVPAAPGQNQFWIPGYWSYTAASKQYTWLSGTWSPFSANWVLAPASYVWTPQGYVFNSLYWDHPLDKRGQAYSCQETDALVVTLPGVILQELLYCYPDYLSLYWHWWHFHPGWWDGCWCLPPWWGWDTWWIFPWADLWGLWWWWSHPGFFPPWWLALELAQEIAPPPKAMIDFMKEIPKPAFPFTPGDTLFPPQGPKDLPPTTRPPIPNDVKPGGKVPTPPFPSTPGTTVIPPRLPSTRPPGYFPGTPTPDRNPNYKPNMRTPNITPNMRSPNYIQTT